MTHYIAIINCVERWLWAQDRNSLSLMHPPTHHLCRCSLILLHHVCSTARARFNCNANPLLHAAVLVSRGRKGVRLVLQGATELRTFTTCVLVQDRTKKLLRLKPFLHLILLLLWSFKFFLSLFYTTLFAVKTCKTWAFFKIFCLKQCTYVHHRGLVSINTSITP